MLEVFVRLAIDKYVKTKQAETYSQAIEWAFERHFLPYFKTFECHTFRKERLWKEEIDILYTRFTPALKEVYKRNSGKYA